MPKTLNPAAGARRMLNCFAPNINIVRDPRWGRGHETYGEVHHPTICKARGCGQPPGACQSHSHKFPISRLCHFFRFCLCRLLLLPHERMAHSYHAAMATLRYMYCTCVAPVYCTLAKTLHLPQGVTKRLSCLGAQDPFLTGRLATAFVRGLQGNDSTYIKVRIVYGAGPCFVLQAHPGLSLPVISA